MSKAKSGKVSPDLDTPTDLPQEAVDKISAALNTLLADAFALYLKTKNFRWHVRTWFLFEASRQEGSNAA